MSSEIFCWPISSVSAAFRATVSPAFSARRLNKVHGIWVPGPGSYGRNDAGDAGIDAAFAVKGGEPAGARPLQSFDVPADYYRFANKSLAWEPIPPLLDRASPLRATHPPEPVRQPIQFASESFIDAAIHRPPLLSKEVA